MKKIENIKKNKQYKEKEDLIEKKIQRIKEDLITKLKDNMDIYFNFCPIFGLTNIVSIIIRVIDNLLIKLKIGTNKGIEQSIDLSILKKKLL